MNDSTRRALRTTYQAAVGLIAVVPVLVLLLNEIGADLFGAESDLYGQLVAVGAGATVVVGAFSKIIITLENKHWLPEWIKKRDPATTGLSVASLDVLALTDEQVAQLFDRMTALDNQPGDHSA